MNRIDKTSTITTSAMIRACAIILGLSLLSMEAVTAKNMKGDQVVQTRIIGGSEASETDWPWMVAISRIGPETVFDRQICGGTLIASDWVLTAAHCVWNNMDLEVFTGQADLTDAAAGKSIQIDKVVVHPDYDPDTANADLALLHLVQPASIPPIVIMNNFNYLDESSGQVKALGWGAKQRIFGVNIFPSTLMEVDLTLESQDVCSEFFSNDDVLCTHTQDGYEGVCFGDSGGPLMFFEEDSETWQQIGIVSRGCTQAVNSYDIFTRLGGYQKFIYSTIKDPAEFAESPRFFLEKCITQYPDFIGSKVGEFYHCEYGNLCQDTTGGELADIVRLSIDMSYGNKTLYYYDFYSGWHAISYAALGYCN